MQWVKALCGQRWYSAYWGTTEHYGGLGDRHTWKCQSQKRISLQWSCGFDGGDSSWRSFYFLLYKHMVHGPFQNGDRALAIPDNGHPGSLVKPWMEIALALVPEGPASEFTDWHLLSIWSDHIYSLRFSRHETGATLHNPQVTPIPLYCGFG